jgi:hypothetical protein
VNNMSEQNTDIVKNYPGSPTESHAHNGDGSFASGAIGGATTTDANGNLSPAASLGNIATANFGSTSGANAVKPNWNTRWYSSTRAGSSLHRLRVGCNSSRQGWS